MMDVKATPGPWGVTTSEPPGQWVLFSHELKPGTAMRLDVGRFVGSAEDARLIAAAPDLLEILKDTARQIESYFEDRAPVDAEQWLADVRAAIARATTPAGH